MQSNRPDWLAIAAADGRGGARLQSIVRGAPWSVTLNFGADYSADSFFMSLRELPDDPDPATEDVSISVGAFAGGVTPVTLSLTKVETAALPADTNDDGLKELFYDILRQVGGAGDKSPIMQGNIFVSGKVTNA